jgi:hypothetical protein
MERAGCVGFNRRLFSSFLDRTREVALRKIALSAVGLVALSTAGIANAAITLSATPGSPPYAGPFTFDWDSPGTTPVTTGGAVQTGNNTVGAQPLGSTGNYFTVGPANVSPPTSSPGFINLASFGAIGSISFLWGSVDDYNTLTVIDRLGNAIAGATFTGLSVTNPANGNQVNPGTNPIVTLTITGADQLNIGGLRLASTQQAFEVDNFRIVAVPEPTTWALLILGFGAIGYSMRRRTQQVRTAKARLQFS